MRKLLRVTTNKIFKYCKSNKIFKVSNNYKVTKSLSNKVIPFSLSRTPLHFIKIPILRTYKTTIIY
jgi:hypothetical protein